MNAQRIGGWALSLLCAGVMALQPRPAQASDFQVSPIRLNLTPSETSGLLNIANRSGEALRFQVEVYRWAEGPKGEMLLTAAPELVVFPSILSVKAGDARKLRVGTRGAFGPVEQSYRVFVEELPPLAQGTSNGVRVLTRMAIPIFMTSPGSKPAPRVEAISLRDGRLSFSLRNVGSAHFKARSIRIVGSSLSHEVFTHELSGWYVLAGGVRVYEVAVPTAACPADRFDIRVQTGGKPFEATLTPTSTSCRP
jgi:fimbrial chaperone protein